MVDVTSELIGFTPVAHRALGERATRLQVKSRSRLHDVMMEAVANHSAEVVVIDEIQNEPEVDAARKIAQQGVIVLATAHSTGLAELAHNPVLGLLVGGVKSTIINDVRVREDRRASKLKEYRVGEPPFQIVIEICGDGSWKNHDEVALAVHSILDERSDECRMVYPSSCAKEDEVLPDTGSSSGCSSMKVQCPGVSKIPAQLVAKLDSGTTYMLCFDGGVSWSESPYKVGAGACFFQIQTDGRRNLHMGNWDATVFWKADRVLIEESEYAGLLAGFVMFEAGLHQTITSTIYV